MTSLKQLIQQEFITAPGVFDGLSARLVEMAGFKAVYASGGAIARSTATPDIGLLSLTEVVDRLKQITSAVSIPVIADADTGFGNELNVMRTIELFESAGVAGLHLEDQTFPKRCGHLKGKTLIPRNEMCLKIKAAVKARSNPDLMIIARTDAIATDGLEEAINRAQYYVDAGADMLFIEAPESLEQISKIAEAISHPKLINMFYGGKTPLVETQQLIEMGYRLAIIPSDLQRAAIRAMQKTLNVICQDGNSKAIADELATFNEREEIVDTKSYFAAVEGL